MVSADPFARIALAIPVLELFDYEVPEALQGSVVPGARVRVPFGRSSRVGYCIERAAESTHDKLKAVQEVLDEHPVLDAHLLQLVRWTADYYLAPVGEVIEAAIPSGIRRAKPKQIRWARLIATADATPQSGVGASARQRVLDVLAEHPDGLPARELRERSATSDSAQRTLAKQGRLEFFDAPAPEEPLTVGSSRREQVPSLPLTPHQADAVAAVARATSPLRFAPFLLHGVTGSGKTEVYLQVIARVLAEGKGALVLIPEIALTPQTVARFEERFGDVAVLHSMLPPRERARAYRRLQSEEVRVAIGARSAVFAPVTNLGVIIVDESHESTYKQESTPRYHARDVAVMRASMLGIPVLLGTATPTLESLENVRRERFECLSLPERVTSHPLPQVEIIDRRTEDPQTKGTQLLSPRLLEVLRETVEGGDQALLFLNRRGFARHTHCPKCGYTLQCRDCDIALTYHKRDDRALCHYCGSVRSVPEHCPECDSPGLRRRTPGTERIEETLGRLLPGVPLARLDRDTATTRDRLVEILETFRKGETRVLVGTQMIAKGHDIPGVTLVGVIDADVALHHPDFRAAERTAQLICQVAGRAGRGARQGRVLIQTRQPEHYAIEAGRLQDMKFLYDRESATRRLLAYPPFGYVVRVVCEDPREDRALTTAQDLRHKLEANLPPGVRVLGPAPAPLARLRNYYRFHMLLKSKERAPLRRAAMPLIRAKKKWTTTRVTVDVDPQSLL